MCFVQYWDFQKKSQIAKNLRNLASTQNLKFIFIEGDWREGWFSSQQAAMIAIFSFDSIIGWIWIDVLVSTVPLYNAWTRLLG